MQDVVILRYGEIGIKSRNVRGRFEGILKNNISECLKNNKIKHDGLERTGSRILVLGKPTEKMLDSLKNVSGVVSISPAKIVETELETIKKEALAVYKGKGKSFRITARRQTKEFELNSRRICEIVGAYVQEKTGARVNLSKPDIDINIEINGNRTAVFSRFIRGVGGLPIGTQGRVLCFVSDKNSIIAVLEVLKRGCTTDLLFANKRIAKTCSRVMKKYYNSRIKYKTSLGSISSAYTHAKRTGANAIVLGCTEVKEISKIPKKDILLIFPLLGYDKQKLKQKTIALK